MLLPAGKGVEHLQNLFPGDEVSLWCGAIDPEMNEHSYIVPGLGDAGDLSFGDKVVIRIDVLPCPDWESFMSPYLAQNSFSV